ncbi:uncharacterized protein LOC124375166 [Homalodisca vitripennis]|uniref:uncharacterized protein LOC124375166 n=1 Tax=Homalodisca vitripennis TaxID=197043 RepID=UPI001EEB3688|nr:uncharacterized protein LOC124375166 [Homalodisca vitripennis]
MCEESSLLMLSWCCELLGQSQPYLTTLAGHNGDDCTGLGLSVHAQPASFSPAVLMLAVCANLRQLVVLPHMSAWKKCVLEEIADVCLLHLDSSDTRVATSYSALWLQLPWTVVMPTLAQGIVKQGSVRRRVEVALHTQLTHDASTGDMSNHHFKAIYGLPTAGTWERGV